MTGIFEWLKDPEYTAEENNYQIGTIRRKVDILINKEQLDDIKLLCLDELNGVRLEPLHVAKLDLLIEKDGNQFRHECKTFAKIIYECYSDNDIGALLETIYENKINKCQLEAFTKRTETDRHTFEYEVDQSSFKSHIGNSEDGIKTLQTKSFHRSSVDMKKIGGWINMGESQVIDCIQSMVDTQIELLWEKLDVESETVVLKEEYDEYLARTIDHLIDNGYSPDLAITQREIDDLKFMVDVCQDQSGTVDVPFVVGNRTDALKIVRQPIDASVKTRCPEPVLSTPTYYGDDQVYTLKWQGNYAVPDSDQFSGPV